MKPLNSNQTLSGNPVPAAISLAVWLVAAGLATATDRFVATNGQNNTNPGRGLSVGSPYLTIDFAADQAAPGDTIYIRGGTYRETVSPTVSGTPNAPIIFKPYNNEAVTLTGLDLITPGSNGAGSWTADTGDIYKIQLTSSYGSESNFSLDRITGCQVFVNGEAMSEARWPNSPTPMGIRRTEAATALSGAYTATGTAGNLIYDALYRHAGLDTFAADIWKDGIIVFAPGSQWYRRVSPITGNTPAGANSEVRFTFNPYNEGANREDTDIGDPFFLMGRKIALDAEKEFFFDTLQGSSASVGRDGPRHMLYLRAPGSVSPAGQVVEMRRRLRAIDLANVSHIQFENLRLLAGRIRTASTTSNCIFRGLNVEYAAYTWEEELGDITASAYIEGTDHQILDGSLRNSTYQGIIFASGGNHVVRNLVVSDCFLAGIEMKTTSSNIRVENVTVYNQAGTAISAEARPNQVLYSHGYQSALFTTDCGTLNALNDFDGMNSEWAYNWMHDALGSVNATRDWYGSPAIRLDSGPSNFLIHHNIAWNTTQPEKTIAIWALGSGQINYQDARIRLYNNSVDQQIGFTETASVPASLRGVEMSNNLAGVGMNISSSGTDATGKLYITDMALRNNLFNNTSIPNNPPPPHSANRQGATGWTAPASPPFGYQLGASSQAINNGTTVAGITDGFVGAAPDIGALESGIKPFVPGAKVRAQDLAGLTVTPTLVSNLVRFIVSGLPTGRSLPDSFRLKIASNAASNDFSHNFDFTNNTVTATYNALSTAGAGQAVQVSLDGTDFVTLPATVTVPASTLAATTTSLTSSSNPAIISNSITFTATVATSGGTPSGTVTFLNGATTLGTGTLSGGIATVTTSSLGIGLHSITATFPASASLAASTSPINLQSVTSSVPTPPGIVRARFTDGNGSTTAQQFNGAAGDGWLAGWTTSTTNSTGTVLSTTPLSSGTGNYLKVTSTSGSGAASQAGVSRQWDPVVRPYDQFTRLTFDFRIDSTATFDNAGDAYTIALSNVAGTAPAGNSTVYLRCFGASPGTGSNGVIAAREWCVFNGIPGTADAYTVSKFIKTGMIAAPGTTCRFTIDIYAAPAAGTASGKTHGTYDVTINDGTNTVSVPGSGFRSASYSSGGYLTCAAQQNSATDALSYSVDSIEMTSLTVLEPTTTVVTSDSNPANIGAPVTFTATVTSGTGTPAGSVTFFDGATNLGTATLNGSGIATISTPALATGSHSITASYPASLIYAASTSPALTQIIRHATSTSLATSETPSNPGQAVTFTATVTSTGGTPTGDVTFFDGASNIGIGVLSSGVATLTTSTLTAGPHSITAFYGATPTFATSTSPALSQFTRSATSTILTSNNNPANPGESITLTATVTAGNSGDTVTFFDGAANIGSGTLSSGIATLTTSALTIGPHSITAVYAATATTAASTSPSLAQVVRSATSTTLASNANPANPGASVTFTATVTGGTPGGTVNFLDGVTPLGSGTLASGIATLATSALTAGPHSITAVYAATATTAASISPPLDQVIRSATSTILTSNNNPANGGDLLTLTATVMGGYSGDTVTFFDGATNIGSGTLSSGVATLTTSTLTAGPHSITAIYAATATTAASTSPPLIQVIRFATTTTVTSSANPANLGDAVTFTASVTGGNAGDTVNFLDGGALIGSGTLASGVATFTTSSLSEGLHSITANYAATATTAASSSAELIHSVLALTPYETWLAGFFTEAELANPALEATVWGLKADPDKDSLANLLEYALELSPILANPLSPGMHATGTPLSLTFKRARAELIYTVQATADFTTWQDLSTNSFPVGTTGTVTDPAPTTTPHHFLRLNVTQP